MHDPYLLFSTSRQRRDKNYLLMDAGFRYKPLLPFGVSTDDVSHIEQSCITYAPLGSLCEAGKYLIHKRTDRALQGR